MIIGTAVLHYGRFDVTARCVESLLSLTIPDHVVHEIVVVDNKSPNDSYTKLREAYGKEEHVFLTQTEENIGFARGNNIAYEHMKNRLNVDIGVFLNNDTEIVDKDFLVKLAALYNHNPFDVLSIDVFDPHADQHQSPLCRGSEMIEYAFNEKARVEKYLQFTPIEKALVTIKERGAQILYPFAAFQKMARNRIKNYSVSAEWQAPLIDVVPQGSCVIFGRKYFDSFDYAFYPRTTMYFEECILKALCDREGLVVRYEPSLQVFHHHHELTRSYIKKNSVRSLQQLAKNEVASYEVFEGMVGQVKADAR